MPRRADGRIVATARTSAWPNRLTLLVEW